MLRDETAWVKGSLVGVKQRNFGTLSWFFVFRRGGSRAEPLPTGTLPPAAKSEPDTGGASALTRKKDKYKWGVEIG